MHRHKINRFFNQMTISDIHLAEEAPRETLETMAEAQRIAHFGNWSIALTPDLEFIAPQTWSDECYRIMGIEPGTVEITRKF